MAGLITSPELVEPITPDERLAADVEGTYLTAEPTDITVAVRRDGGRFGFESEKLAIRPEGVFSGPTRVTLLEERGAAFAIELGEAGDIVALRLGDMTFAKRR